MPYTGIRSAAGGGGTRGWVTHRRAYRAGKKVAYAKVARSRRRLTFRRGFDRVGGFYGRYGGRRSEQKFHDLELNANLAGAGAVTDSLNLIAQNVTESGRIGRKCTISNVSWRYSISLPEIDAVATPASPDVVRVIVFLDKQCNGATATVTDVLESANFQSFNNLANKSRFRTLMDRTHNINYLTLASDGAAVVSSANVREDFSWYKKCSIPLEFDGVTGAITELRSNNIGVLLISRDGLATLDSKFRLRFTG